MGIIKSGSVLCFPVEALLPNMIDWFIQAGCGGMTAAAGDKSDFILGGSQADVLVGDDQHWRQSV